MILGFWISVLGVIYTCYALYDKFVGFLEDLESIGGAISKSEQFYASAMNKLSEGKGNLILTPSIIPSLSGRGLFTITRKT